MKNKIPTDLFPQKVINYTRFCELDQNLNNSIITSELKLTCNFENYVFRLD